MSSKIPEWISLNSQIVHQNVDGSNTYNFEKDKEAVHSYFVDYVNQNTVFFHDLREKLNYLIDNNYYDKEVFDMYSFNQIKEIFKIAYAKKYRFSSYMGASKFYNDYALKTDDKEKFLERYEDRVAATALVLGGGDFTLAKRIVVQIIDQKLQPATPTFLNAGRKRRGELVSCFLLEVNDSLNDISKAQEMAMQLSKIGGGVSLNLSKLRAKGESIKDIQGVVKGVVGVMKLLDVAFRYADQMGQRQGSGAAYLNIFHADIDDFLDTKKVAADEDVRVKTLSIGVVIPDKFIQLAREDKDMYVFYPHSVYKEYGIHLDDMDITAMYDQLVDNPRVRKDKKNPRKLLEKLAVLRYESGYPYIMFQDNVNRKHANNEISRVKFSNLCTEILQVSKVSTYTDYGMEDELGLDISCNLASVNIVNVMEGKSLEETIVAGTYALTTVTNSTSINNAPAVKKANELMHSIGLGAMNLAGWYAKNGIQYGSPISIEFASAFFAAMNYYSLKTSMEIARDRKETYYGYEKSTYANGNYFDKYLENSYLPTSEKVVAMFEGIALPTQADWAWLKDEVAKHGIYHAYRLAIAPNGSISYIQSATASVMPIMERIEQRTYGNSKTYYPMPYLSEKNWFVYQEAYFMDMFKVVDVVAAIQEHIDQGISFTLFLTDKMTTRDLTRIDLYAHHRGIGTLYYARTKNTSIDDCLSCSV